MHEDTSPTFFAIMSTIYGTPATGICVLVLGWLHLLTELPNTTETFIVSTGSKLKASIHSFLVLLVVCFDPVMYRWSRKVK